MGGPARIRAAISSGVPVLSAQVRNILATAPSGPTGLVVLDRGHRYIRIGWQTPDDNDSPITAYEVRIGTGAWMPTRTLETEFLIENLEPGTAYSITVRARNSKGPGTASAALTAQTVAATAPSAPRFPRVLVVSGTVIDLLWSPPLDAGGSPVTGYEVCVMHPDGRAEPFEPTTGAELSWIVRGLARGYRYGFRVRAVNSAGVGFNSEVVYAVAETVPVLAVPAGQQIPLVNTARQSLIVRLRDMDCRVKVWWQPWDAAWYGAVEVPTNTPVVQGRRIAANTGLLDGLLTDLDGNIVCRALDSSDDRLEPARNAWNASTHGLFWEPGG